MQFDFKIPENTFVLQQKTPFTAYFFLKPLHMRPQINYDSYLLDFHLFSPLHPPLQLVIAVKEKQRAL